MTYTTLTFTKDYLCLCHSLIQRIIHDCFPGAFFPLTLEGTIVVDEVLVSCFATVDHDFGNIGVAPMLWFPRLIEWIFGEDKGFSIYANIGEEVGRLMLPYKENKFVTP